MGEEADADWQAGLIEAGIEEEERSMKDKKFAETPFTRQFKRDCEALRRRLSKTTGQGN